MRKYILLFLLVFVLALVGYSWFFYYDVHSSGTRVGVLEKISEKGIMFKTYEGKLILKGFRASESGVIKSDYFYFTASDFKTYSTLDSVAGKEVKLHYLHYRKHLPWRGENHNEDNKNEEVGQYIVDRIDYVKDDKNARF